LACQVKLEEFLFFKQLMVVVCWIRDQG
jgi:hypothetical protein